MWDALFTVRPERDHWLMLSRSPAQRLAAHVQSVLGDGPFHPSRGWTHMGAVMCDASFHARRRYRSTIRPRLLRLQSAWPDAATARGFKARIITEDLAVVMDFNAPGRVATAHAIPRCWCPGVSIPGTISMSGSVSRAVVPPCAP